MEQHSMYYYSRIFLTLDSRLPKKIKLHFYVNNNYIRSQTRNNSWSSIGLKRLNSYYSSIWHAYSLVYWYRRVIRELGLWTHDINVYTDFLILSGLNRLHFNGKITLKCIRNNNMYSNFSKYRNFIVVWQRITKILRMDSFY